MAHGGDGCGCACCADTHLDFVSDLSDPLTGFDHLSCDGAFAFAAGAAGKFGGGALILPCGHRHGFDLWHRHKHVCHPSSESVFRGRTSPFSGTAKFVCSATPVGRFVPGATGSTCSGADPTLPDAFGVLSAGDIP